MVATAGRASAEDAAAAVATADGGLPRVGGRPAAERAEALVRAAAALRERRLELAALMVRECAKPWAEADADACEAIDFLEYYARAAVELDAGEALLQVPGERNAMRHVPRGVAAVIAPWNFPLAIATGMTAAALAAGNAVVLKPAEQSPGVRADAGARRCTARACPRRPLSLLPGFGDAGAALVRDPRVHTIAFTGSQAVGLEIIRTAAETPDGQGHVKRVVAEMGGKNCVIVDSDADLDEVVPAVVHSAFGFAGQKCSAAARVLAHEAVHDGLVERLAGAVEVLDVGQAERFATEVPPVIDEEAQRPRERLRARRRRRAARRRAGGGAGGRLVLRAHAGGRPAAGRARAARGGLRPAAHRGAVASVEAACDVVDSLPVALTGGLFSRNPATVRAVAARTPVGNLYVNRGITGAMVARQPFGGNRRSGIGAKAGGPGYLLQFTEPRVVTENTMRHGLVVE